MIWHRLFDWFIDELFPRFCVGCRREGIDACQDCLAALPLDPQWQTIADIDVWSAYAYKASGIGRFIQAWKYRGATTCIDALLTTVPWPVLLADIIIPVPLHRRKRLERGFNQAETIAASLAHRTDAPVVTVRRRRFTKAQALCDGEERRRNVRGAFTAAGRDLEGKRVILVDDVVTTGSTLNELAVALREAGAHDIRAVCLARGG